MTLLTMVQNVADETKLFQAPTTVISNQNKEIKQALVLIKKICRELLEAHDWQVLTKEETFTTDGTGTYTLASIFTDGDYERVLTDTEWDRSNNKKLLIVSAAQWQYIKSGIISQTGVTRWGRVRGNNLIITPDASGDTLVVEYLSNYYATSSGGTAKATFTADDDTTPFKEHLIELGLKYYIKSENDLDATEDCDRYYSTMESLVSEEKPMPVLRPQGYGRVPFVVNIPDTGAGL